MSVVILDARLTKQMSVGMQTYVRELAARLPEVAQDLEFVAVTNAALETNARVHRIDDAAARNGTFAEQFKLPSLLRELARGRRAIAHFMSVYAPRTSPVPHVYTIHDLIHLRYPRYFSWKIPLYYAWAVGPSARRARRLITDAEATKGDLERFLGASPERIRAIPLGVDDRFRLDEAGRQEAAREVHGETRAALPYLLYAGNHRAHKNLETLVLAWQHLAAPCDLVVTESTPFTFDIDRYGKAGGRIVRPGHVNVDDLLRLYAGCAAAVQPSLYEGFGLSVIEGMAAGAPMVVAQTPALLEVAGDAALTFPPGDADALTRELARVLAGGPAIEAMRERGRRRASGYTWDATARWTAQVYREAMEDER